MTAVLPLLGAALITGLLGSAHCLGMCAGISGLFSVSADVASVRSQFPRAIAYNIGRLLSYALLGALVALAGQSAVAAIPAIAAPVRLAGGLLIVLIGLQVAFGWRLLAPLETLGARLWQRVAPAARKLVPVRSLPQALGLGLIWGWLPCGLVYSVLLLAATTTDATAGALVMVAFGLGTLPAMIATGLGAFKLGQFMARKRFGAGLLIVLIGVATIAMPLTSLVGRGNHDESMNHGSGHITPTDGDQRR